MSCVICGMADKEVSNVANFMVRRCEQCGFYGISVGLAGKISRQEFRLNKERTKAYLSMRSKNQQPPWITSVEIEHYALNE